MSSNSPRISVCIPTHDIPERGFFLDRLMESLEKQTFQDFEVVVTEEGAMAHNTNEAIKKAKGDIVKILFMDDYLYSPFALQHIHHNFRKGWLVSGCIQDEGSLHSPHSPSYNDDMLAGKNTIGSPSVLAFENNDPLLFDEELSWLLDCDLYHRLHKRYGGPTIIDYVDVAIGVGPHQTTNTMSEEAKQKEHEYLQHKYGTSN